MLEKVLLYLVYVGLWKKVRQMKLYTDFIVVFTEMKEYFCS